MRRMWALCLTFALLGLGPSFRRSCNAAEVNAPPPAHADKPVEREATENGHPTFDKVLKFLWTVAEQGGAISAWSGPADPLLAGRSPDEVTQWLSDRLAQLEKHMVTTPQVLFGAELRACAYAGAALQQMDTPGAEAGDLQEDRFRVLSRTLSVAQRLRPASTVAIGLGIHAYGKDYPDDKSRYCALLVKYLHVVVAAATQMSPTVWTVAQPVGCDSRREFCSSVESEGRLFFFEQIKKVYEANAEHRGGAYAAIYLAQSYWYDVPDGRPEARALIAKHREAWEGDDELWEAALRALGEVVAPITLQQWFEVTDTTGRKWSVDDLKGKTTMLCFFHVYQFMPSDRFRKRNIQVIGIPLDKAVGQQAPFTAIADPKKSDVAKLRELFRVRFRMPSSYLVTPALRVLETRQSITEYITEHFPEEPDGAEAPGRGEPAVVDP